MAKQCKRCNRDLGGNPIPFRMELVRRIGEAKVVAIETDTTVHKWTKEYLQRLADIFNRKARILKKRIMSK